MMDDGCMVFVSDPPPPGEPEPARATYRREPYVRAVIPTTDGGTITVTGKATAWTPNRVLVDWETADREPHFAWVRANNVTRIRRQDSTWQDPYDQIDHYE